MAHQQQFLDWTEAGGFQHVACLMEMRLGKTLASIRLVHKWGVHGPCFVVAPVTVLEAWEKELSLEGEVYVVAHGLSPEKRAAAVQTVFELGECGRRAWCLINYESLRAMPELSMLPWCAVILDESTAIKNPKAQISKLCCKGFRNVLHRMILSGLPNPEGDLNLFQQFKFLHGTFMSCDNYYRFRARYFEPSTDYSWGEWMPLPGTKQAIKELVHRKAYVLRRQQAGIAGRKVRETRSIAMEPEQEAIYREIERDFATSVAISDINGLDSEAGLRMLYETEHAIVQHTWMARVAGGCDVAGKFLWEGKYRELLSLLKGELYGENVVVWFRFNNELKAVLQRLRLEGVPCRALVGEMMRPQRVEALEWFRSSTLPRKVLLCQIKLAKYGVDASAADTAIYYSMTYSCEEVAQSEDRIFHPMKQSPLLYLYLVSQDSIDEDVIYATNQKVTSAKLFMTNLKVSFLKRKERMYNVQG